MNTLNFDTNTMSTNDYATFEEVAKALGVRYQQVYHRAESGRLGVIYELFGKKLVHKAEIARWQTNRAAYFEHKSDAAVVAETKKVATERHAKGGKVTKRKIDPEIDGDII